MGGQSVNKRVEEEMGVGESMGFSAAPVRWQGAEGILNHC